MFSLIFHVFSRADNWSLIFQDFQVFQDTWALIKCETWHSLCTHLMILADIEEAEVICLESGHN